MNNQYKYFVFNMHSQLIFSGWEFKVDAIENKNELQPGYKIYTKSYLKNNLKIDVNDLKNWETYYKKENCYNCDGEIESAKNKNNINYSFCLSCGYGEIDNSEPNQDIFR